VVEAEGGLAVTVEIVRVCDIEQVRDLALYQQALRVDLAQALSDRGQRLAEENGFANLIVAAAPQRTWLKIRSGRGVDARAEITAAIQQYNRNRSFNPTPVSPMLLADACRMTGLIDAGLALVEAVWRDTRAPGVRWYDADLRRLEGELLLAGGGQERRGS